MDPREGSGDFSIPTAAPTPTSRGLPSSGCEGAAHRGKQKCLTELIAGLSVPINLEGTPRTTIAMTWRFGQYATHCHRGGLCQAHQFVWCCHYALGSVHRKTR